MLSPYRVLDLTGRRGQLAGAILAQLGAEVILVEPPGGSDARTTEPSVDGRSDIEAGLHHQARNRGKASIVLDLEGSGDDRATLVRLAAGADVLIESGRPGELAALGLGPDDLASVNPSLVYASISPFGQTGPKAHYHATDLVVWAAAGPLVLTGDADRPPLRVPSDQAWAHAAAEAAGAVIAALFERGTSGHGQHLDVSAQQAAAQATQSMVLAAPNGQTLATRGSGGAQMGPIFVQLRWPCADGHVSVTFLFGSALGVASSRLMHLVHAEGFCDQATRDKDWVAYGELLLTGAEPVEEYERVKRCIGAFCQAHTKAELLDLALEHGLLIAPVLAIDDVVGLDQLASRDYWDDVDGVRHPGPFARMSETPLRRPGRAPTLGADTERVLAEPARQPAAPAPSEPPPRARPLEGVKILDFMWVMAGPAGTRVLTDLGATVVRLESNVRVDTARTLQPFKNEENGLETSALFANLNAGKLTVTLNPTNPASLPIVEDLIRWADVVTESFSPRGMRSFGLDYDTIRAINPSVIMQSSCLFGQTGPLAEFAGYGTMAAAMTGFFSVTGWPDRAPSGPFGAYTDYIAPRFANAALLAALDHRRRTGEGQYIDFAQAEGSIHALAPLVLDYTVNGRITTPAGNTEPGSHPHGVFAVAGDDRWIAVACETDAQRRALAQLCGDHDDGTLARWLADRDGQEAEATLQAAGVPAHVVADSDTMVVDPHLVDRGHFVDVPNATMGSVTVEGPRVRYSRTPSSVGDAPTLGQFTNEVLTGLVGLDEERFVEALVAGALE